MLLMVLSDLSSHRRGISGDSPLAFSTVKVFIQGAPMGGQRGVLMLLMVLSELSSHRRGISGDSLSFL